MRPTSEHLNAAREQIERGDWIRALGAVNLAWAESLRARDRARLHAVLELAVALRGRAGDELTPLLETLIAAVEQNIRFLDDEAAAPRRRPPAPPGLAGRAHRFAVLHG